MHTHFKLLTPLCIVDSSKATSWQVVRVGSLESFLVPSSTMALLQARSHKERRPRARRRRSRQPYRSPSVQAIPECPSPATGVGKWGALQCHPLRNSPHQLLIWAYGELLIASTPKTLLICCWRGETGCSSAQVRPTLISWWCGLMGATWCKRTQYSSSVGVG